MSLHRLSERIAEVWYGNGRPADDAVCLGVIAGLCLLVWPDQTEHTLRATAMMQNAKDDEIADMLAQAWAAFWIARPELAFRCGCLGEWLNEDPRDKQTVRAAAQVARAAIKAGLWTGKYGAEDVLGTIWTAAMRSNSARKARGEFYTPPSLCRMMAEMVLIDVQPGTSICEPAVGTGGMFLGAAQALRSRGQDPADYAWVGNDVSHVSVACLCVNAHIWGLGPNVLFGVADSLREPDWTGRALQEQQAAVEHRNELAHTAGMLAAYQHALRLASGPPDGEPVTELELEPIEAGPRPLRVPVTGDQEAMF